MSRYTLYTSLMTLLIAMATMTSSVRARSPHGAQCSSIVPFVASCEASLRPHIIRCNAHLFAVITDVVQPLFLWSSFGAMTVCVSMQKQMWIVVTSHDRNRLICVSVGLEQLYPVGYPALSIYADFVYGLSLHTVRLCNCRI